MVYEMRFQTVDPARRAEYVKIYREAVQGCKSAGSTGGHILCSDDDPAAVVVILLWESKEHLARWRGTDLLQILSRRGGGATNQEEPRRALCGGDDLKRLICR